MEETQRTISIVILTYNRVEILRELLESISLISYSPLDVIVVDNHSTDGTEALLTQHYSRYTYIRTEKNLGVSARNLGIEKARGAIVICLDDDVFGINDRAIHDLIDCFNNNRKIGAINFKIIHYDTGEICNWVHHCDPDMFSEKTFSTYEITEGAVAFRKTAINLSGLYPDFYFISHEGPDLAYRLINIGFDVIYTGRITVRHRHSNLGRESWFNYYYDTRNHLWLAARHFPALYLMKYLFISLSSTLVYSIRDGFLKYWLKAIVDGLVGLPTIVKGRKVLSHDTMDKIHEIDRNRPPILYLLKTRLFRKSIR